jgi:glycosyltransferase involved in cell wall biosynthesis
MGSEFSVIICAYTEKRWDELRAAVESVQRQTLPPKEIIVVIDRNPALQLRVKKEIADIIVIENKGAQGASGARNSGATKACGEFLAFLDDDAEAAPDWLEQLAACFGNPQVAGVGGKILPRWATRRPTWFPEEFYWVVGCSYRGLPVENAVVRNVIGANMSVRRKLVSQVNGFRESFGNIKGDGKVKASSKWFQHSAGDEETEFCMRVTQLLPASKWLYAPAAVVRHYVPSPRTYWRFFLWRCYDEGLGKASLARLHDASKALSSERSYTLKVLPKGCLRGLADTLFRRDVSGILRTGAIVSGLAMTTAGYIVGSVVSYLSMHSKSNPAPLRPQQHRHAAETLPPVNVR